MNKISRSKATAKIVLTHKSKKSIVDGKQTIQLRIIYNRKPKYYSLGFSVFEDDFNKMFNGVVRGELRDLKIKLQEIEYRANQIIAELDPFSFYQFENKLFRPNLYKNDVYTYLDLEIKRNQKEGKVSSKEFAKCSLNSFKEFTKGKPLSFYDITVDWLNSYEKYMLRKQRSITTVGMYLRTLRTVFNKAIKNGVITNQQYPFGKGKYEIPTGNNIKKALSKSDLEKIFKYEVKKGSKEDWAKDMWLFIYLCNGINPKDIAALKYENIGVDSITFFRKKTNSSKRQQKAIVVPLTPPIINIIDKWANRPQAPLNYIFDILKPNLTPQQIHSRVHDFYSDVNAYMKKIADDLNIKSSVTTYTARHSYATVMKLNGASVELISESLGHSNIKTTENYLASFDLKTKLDWSEKLYQF